MGLPSEINLHETMVYIASGPGGFNGWLCRQQRQSATGQRNVTHDGFLREMEMVKQAEMMQDLPQVEQVGDSISNEGGRKPLPAKRKEAAK